MYNLSHACAPCTSRTAGMLAVADSQALQLPHSPLCHVRQSFPTATEATVLSLLQGAQGKHMKNHNEKLSVFFPPLNRAPISR